MGDTARPVSPHDPDLLLDEVCRRCVEELGVDHAAIAVATGDGGWAPAHATGSLPRTLEQFAFTTGEGPGFDAIRDGVPVLVPDLQVAAALRRWPAWMEVAAAYGVRSIAAFPIQAGAITSGALTVFSYEVGRFDRHRVSRAVQLADLAFFGLLDLISGLEHRGTAGPRDQPDVASILRADVHQAAGMVMIQAEVPIDQALARLRALAYSSGRSLSDVAADVLHRKLRFAPDSGSA